MLQPGIDKKGLNKSTVVRRILEYSPVVRAVAAALVCQLGDRLQERFALRRIDVVLRSYKYWSAIAFDFVSGDRCRPLNRGRQVEVSAGLQLPSPRQRYRYQRTARCDEVGKWQAGNRRNLPPYCAANSQAGGKDCYEHRKSSPAHLSRQRDLRRNIETGQHGDPRHASDQTCGQSQEDLVSEPE